MVLPRGVEDGAGMNPRPLTQLLRGLRSLPTWFWLFFRASVSPAMKLRAELSVSNLAHCQHNSSSIFQPCLSQTLG